MKFREFETKDFHTGLRQKIVINREYVVSFEERYNIIRLRGEVVYYPLIGVTYEEVLSWLTSNDGVQSRGDLPA